MKKLTYLFGLGILASSLFISCSDDEDALDPTLSITSDNPVVAAPNSSVTVEWRADAGDAKLATFTILEGNAAVHGWDDVDIDNASNDTYVDQATLSVGTEDTQFTLIVTDKDGNEDVATLTVTIDNTQTGDPIQEFSARLMGAQGSNTGSFLDADAGTVLTQANAETNAALVDVVYYYGTTNTATLTAPDDATVNGGAGNLTLCVDFSVKNATRFETTSLTASDFDAIEDDLAFVESVSESKITQLAVGDVIAFETEAGKKGMIHVSALEASSAGTITIDVKIQE